MKEFDLEAGEHVLIETRKHWLLFVVELLPYALLALLPFVLIRIISLVPQELVQGNLAGWDNPMLQAGIALWLLLVWTAAWGAFTRYFLNVWVVTNLRIVEIHQRGFFNREVSSVLLNRVQDVTTEVVGLLSSVLSIGDIKVQSAGADVEFHMRGIPRPEDTRDLIMNHVAKDSKTNGL